MHARAFSGVLADMYQDKAITDEEATQLSGVALAFGSSAGRLVMNRCRVLRSEVARFQETLFPSLIDGLGWRRCRPLCAQDSVRFVARGGDAGRAARVG